MKGTVFSVALNHRSQLDAWDQAFHQPPYQTRPKPRSGLSNRATPTSPTAGRSVSGR